ncbi:unnamed protein product [Ranitomeya imitator]|uniref:Costars family protein ABRACL n=2 Tax=Ranitomeya imitator TaxID=111125 RepID=A0ABN9LA88_9NEOB|nr:unnamed protein product [Ranitomeya imitator]
MFMVWDGHQDAFTEFVRYLGTSNTMNMGFTSQFGGTNLVFLDVQLCIEDGGISTRVYRKPSACFSPLLWAAPVLLTLPPSYTFSSSFLALTWSRCEPSCRDHRSTRTRSITMNVDHEVGLLVEEIRRLGTKGNDGKLSVKFGVLFNDDKCANLFEALVGTLKAAKRRKIITYSGELLLQGVHDDTDIVLLQD